MMVRPNVPVTAVFNMFFVSIVKVGETKSSLYEILIAVDASPKVPPLVYDG